MQRKEKRDEEGTKKMEEREVRREKYGEKKREYKKIYVEKNDEEKRREVIKARTEGRVWEIVR